jgi:mRNA-degrading endonuclease YafQ of YafQ-DinJ toxin-antitoxin module
MYQLEQSQAFIRDLKKLIKSKRISFSKVDKVFYQLAKDPFASSLKTHKVSSKNYGLQYSSRLDGDLRLIWNFDANRKLVIIMLDIGGHSGADSVY